MRQLVIILALCGAFVLGVVVGRSPLLAYKETSTPSSSTETVEQESSAIPAQRDTVIKTNALSESQQQMLTSLGINASEIVITPAMIACAEAKVGAARLKELEGGSMPSVAEGLSLLACYRQ